ncbi:hypothetical protein GIB67_041442 [Kingdonia uniflora]|uniref:Uncharacterized protein n=1 Tax=Kingdonia uniflora TaxID=39325 RepID=A0A7J7LRK4_9MAGN|nr:hypothetical protein GIB67_041442 [Kingdonia uniflora]
MQNQVLSRSKHLRYCLQVKILSKKDKETHIPVAEFGFGGMIPVDVQKTLKKEFEMVLQDRVMEETQDKKNMGEAHGY